MSTHTKFDFAADLINIHKVITRALDVVVDNNTSAFEKHATGRAEFDGYILYAACLMRQLHEHHSNEDTVGFPRFRQLHPEAPYDLLMSQHAEMIDVVEQAESAITAAKAETHDADTQAQLSRRLIGELIATEDPRVIGGGDQFDTYPYRRRVR